jgi:gamma-glutamylcyclotransferase (GGCT)/AIG2-like uncharacterized protein YtfP
MIKLFTYGSLQHDDVQENLFGRVLDGTPEKLIGYVLKRFQIEEEFGIVHYPVIVETKNEDDYIDGIVYEITEKELNQADLYEGINYKRVEVHLHSDQKAWAYSAANLTHY